MARFPLTNLDDATAEQLIELRRQNQQKATLSLEMATACEVTRRLDFADSVSKACDQVDKIAIRVALTFFLLCALWSVARTHLGELTERPKPAVRQSIPRKSPAPTRIILRFGSG